MYIVYIHVIYTHKTLVSCRSPTPTPSDSGAGAQNSSAKQQATHTHQQLSNKHN